jgi:hypothetical protein
VTINFFAPGEIPQPPELVKIEAFNVEIYPDRWRLKVNINLTPFRVRPNVAIALVRNGESVQVVADMTIIETMHNKMEFTMHIRGMDDPMGSYTLKARLYYQQGVHEPTDEVQLPVEIPHASQMPMDSLDMPQED